MKKLLITIVLFLLALTVVAATDLTPLLKDLDYRIEADVQLPKMPAINDFSQPFVMDKAYDMPIAYPVEEAGARFNHLWYKQDFSESPFDGKIEVLVMGEPLPTPFTTLLSALATVGIIIMYTHKSSKQEKTLVH